MADNPFQIVYDSLWTMMEEDPRFVVKEGNKIKFNNNNREPYKTNHSTNDYPEVMLIPENGSGNLCNTSSSSMITKNYSWVIAAGDFRYTEVSDLEWAIFAGMLGWQYRLKPLLWQGYEFVKCVRLLDTNLDRIERERTRGIQGWISIWSVGVEMHFSNELIRGSHLILGQS